MIQLSEKQIQEQSFKTTFTVALNNYLNTLELPENIVKAIADKQFIENNPVYYTYYPYLFNTVFKIENKKILDVLTIAGFLYYKAIILVDEMFDNQSPKDSFFSYLISDICKEESIKLLSSLFPNNHQFWKSWNSRKFQYVKAFEIDQKSHAINSYEGFEKLADYKSAFGKVAIDALYHISKLNDIVLYTDLLNAHKFFYTAFQITDDVSDLQEDIENGQFNIAYFELTQEIGEQEIKGKTIKNLKKAMYLNGTAVKLYDKALGYLEKAKKTIAPYDLPAWKIEIQKLYNEIVKNQLNMSGFVAVFHSRQKLSNQKINNYKSPEIAFDNAKKFIQNSQNKEKGNWIDYFNDAGISDIWTTGFLLSQEENNINYKIDTTKAVAFLQQHTAENNIWGYNSKWISDADSTTFVLRALLKNNIKISEEQLNNWYSFQNEDGGFSTYKSKEEVIVSLNFSTDANVKGWLNSHFCVSAAAYLFLCEANIKNRAFFNVKKYLEFIIQQEDAVKSYWWTHDVYAFNLILKGAFLIEDINMIKLASSSLENFVKSTSYTKLKEDKNCFYLGLLLESLIVNNLFLEKYKQDINEIVSIVLNEQLKDGSWLENASMRIPQPSIINANSSNVTWKVSDSGTNIIVKDFHRLFTTSACISGLSSYINSNL
ncbi:prenyltransferase/squalene oxidase repeat-containing protein [Tenacibaculum ovolyticum]|uniref:hypothetical protein n=1 Tax=Tenacibaculum ovolyticum TaxID=104270 RepID=UPI0004188109|nr:hypothetical protein [Tenacibaculum ovolyticum]